MDERNDQNDRSRGSNDGRKERPMNDRAHGSYRWKKGTTETFRNDRGSRLERWKNRNDRGSRLERWKKETTWNDRGLRLERWKKGTTRSSDGGKKRQETIGARGLNDWKIKRPGRAARTFGKNPFPKLLVPTVLSCYRPVSC